MPKLLISDELSPCAVETQKERGVDVVLKTGLSPEELLDNVSVFDGLFIQSATNVTAEILAAAPKLEVVGRAGTGVDNVDISAVTEKGIVVMNTPYGNAVTTAEHAVTMMLSFARQIPVANALTQAGKWENQNPLESRSPAR